LSQINKTRNSNEMLLRTIVFPSKTLDQLLHGKTTNLMGTSTVRSTGFRCLNYDQI